MNEKEVNSVFEIGEEIPEVFRENFIGKVYLKMLIESNSEFECPIGNVTFAPGARNNWHKHPGGQILLVTNGEGWYQEEGKKARKLQKGDVVQIPENVKHWHGATKTSWFTHLSIETKCKKGSAQWLEPVEEEQYNTL